MTPTKKKILGEVIGMCIRINDDFPQETSGEDTFSGKLHFNLKTFDTLIRQVQLLYFKNKKIDASIRDILWQGTIPEFVDYIHHVLSNQTIQKNIPITQIMKILPHELGIIMVDVVEEVCPDLDPPRIRAKKMYLLTLGGRQSIFQVSPSCLGI